MGGVKLWTESDVLYGKGGHSPPLPVVRPNPPRGFVATLRNYDSVDGEHLRAHDYAASGDTPEAAYAALVKYMHEYASAS